MLDEESVQHELRKQIRNMKLRNFDAFDLQFDRRRRGKYFPKPVLRTCCGCLWKTVHFDLTIHEVDNPVFWDARSRIFLGFLCSVEAERGVGNLNHQRDVAGPWVTRGIIANRSTRDDHIGFRLPSGKCDGIPEPQNPAGA